MSTELDIGQLVQLNMPLRIPSVRQMDRTLGEKSLPLLTPRVVRDAAINEFLVLWADVGLVRIANVLLDPAEVATQVRAVVQYETPEGTLRETLFPMRWDERSWNQAGAAPANFRTRFTAKIPSQVAATWIRPTFFGILLENYDNVAGQPDESIMIYDAGHSVGPIPGINLFEGRKHRVLDVSATTRFLLTTEPRTKQVGITATDALGVFWVGDRQVAIGRGARLTGSNVSYENAGAPLYIVVETKPLDDELQVAEVFGV